MEQERSEEVEVRNSEHSGGEMIEAACRTEKVAVRTTTELQVP